jgi:hydrogenase maturation protease
MRHALPDADDRPRLTVASSGVVILGTGNDLRGDDAAGLELIRRIRGRPGPPWLAVREHPGDPVGLLDAWQGCAAAVIVDAMDCGGSAPGAIRRLDASRVPLPTVAVSRASTHGAGIGEAIELARMLERLPRRVIVYAVQGERFQTGAGLSEPVRAALPALADAVLAEAVRLRNELAER